MKSYNKPLKYFILYILFTVAFSFWGPKIYVDYDKMSVFIYIIAFLICFSIGYLGGISQKTIGLIRNSKINQFQRVRFLKTCIIFTFISVFSNFIILLIEGKLHLSLSSIGSNYNNFYTEHNVEKGSYSIQNILVFIMGFPKLVSLVLGLYYYKNLTRKYRIGVILIIFLLVLTNTVGSGNQKTLGDIIIYLMVVLFVKSLDFNKAKRRKLIFKILGIIVLFTIALSIIQFQRLDDVGLTIGKLNDRMNPRTYYDLNDPFFKIFGIRYGLGLANFLTGYLSGGYYGLSLCFKLDFVWTYGIGSSFSMMMFFQQFLGVFELHNTYLMRMQETFGWNGLMAWNTIFPWLASDFTFIGALLFFIPFGYVYAVSWKEVVLYRNPISLLMFSMLTMGLFFVPANNQLVHGIDGFITTTIMIFIWIFKHKKYNIVSSR